MISVVFMSSLFYFIPFLYHDISLTTILFLSIELSLILPYYRLSNTECPHGGWITDNQSDQQIISILEDSPKTAR